MFKKLMTAIALFTFTQHSIAESIITPIPIGGEFPARLEISDFNIDVGYQFESIEKVCITGSVKSGDANQLVFSAFQEPISNAPPFAVAQLILLNDAAGVPIPPYPDEIRICDKLALPSNFLDSNGRFSLSVSDGYLELWNLNLEIEGEISPTQVQLTMDNTTDSNLPFYGGKVRYNAKIKNLDNTTGKKAFKQWSVLSFPNGDALPVHKMREYQLGYTEEKLFNRNYINIPSWFETGEYTLTWYVADPETGKRIKDRISFTKE